jgi:hypothetical protein
MVLAERHARERLARIEVAIAELMPGWSLAPVVEALRWSPDFGQEAKLGST